MHLDRFTLILDCILCILDKEFEQAFAKRKFLQSSDFVNTEVIQLCLQELQWYPT